MLNNKMRKELYQSINSFRVTATKERSMLIASLRALVTKVNHLSGENYEIPTSSHDLSKYCEDLTAYCNDIQYRCKEEVDLELFRAAYAASAFLKKYPFSGSSNLRREAAIRTFQTGEMICAETNLRFHHEEFDPVLINKMRVIIQNILGDLTPSILIDMMKKVSPGPGLTSNPVYKDDPARCTMYWKYTNTIQTTPAALNLTKYMISSNPLWLSSLYCNNNPGVPGFRFFRYHNQQDIERTVFSQYIEETWTNRITFVPKNAKTDRTIAMEPCGNVMLQKALGTFLKKRLHKVGISLFDQSINQQLARQGSKDSSLATIDLSMASDTLAYNVVRTLLPADWFQLFDQLRTPKGMLDGQEITYAKFSSMGNGYTFELESLIFLAACQAILELKGVKPLAAQNHSVYGDDIIFPTEHTPSLINALTQIGFSVNNEKSFLSGPFRESCGGDFFMGHDVRPLYLKRRIRKVKDVNFILNLTAWHSLEKNSTLYHSVHHIVLRNLPKKYWLPGPISFATVVDDRGKATLDASDLESNLKLPHFVTAGLEDRYLRGHSSVRFLSIRTSAIRSHARNSCGAYLSFLKGLRGGTPVLRGVTRDSLVWSKTFQCLSILKPIHVIRFFPIV